MIPFMIMCGMGREEWERIRSALRFSDISDSAPDLADQQRYHIHGASDPFKKIRSLLELFRTRCLEVLVPGRYVCFYKGPS